MIAHRNTSFTDTLASRVFRLTPEECLAGVTCNAARALGLEDRGTMEIGHPQELSDLLGSYELTALYVAGQRL
jgi:imidazolonepropionase